MRLIVCLVLVGCAASPRPPARTGPLREVRGGGPARSECLVVFLPGAGDRPEDYFSRGFVQRMRDAGIRADAVAVDASVMDYRSGRAIRSLRDDVLTPARTRYRSVWLVGISIGGGGALRAAAVSPELVDHLVLLAPFLGGRGLMREVREAGGPADFEPSEELLSSGGPFVAAWRWAGHRQRSARDEVSLYVGWGHEDALAEVAKTLAMSLPPSHVLRGGGGHRWVVWSDIWRGLVASGFMQRECGVERETARAEARSRLL